MGLHNSEGNWVTSEAEVEGVAVNYFNVLFVTTSPSGYEEFLKEVQAKRIASNRRSTNDYR